MFKTVEQQFESLEDKVGPTSHPCLKNPFCCDQVIPHMRIILEEPFDRKTYN